MFGMNPQEVGYIRLCEGLNVGSSDLSKLNIQKIKL